MSMTDYRLCDKCGGKAFYDACLNYRFDPDDPSLTPAYRTAGKLGSGMQLDNLGDWAVICTDCAREYRCVIVRTRWDGAA